MGRRNIQIRTRAGVIKRHETRVHTLDLDLGEDKLARIAQIEPATDKEVEAVTSAEQNGDGRSNWIWVRLANGDLYLAMAPQGDTYELVTQTMIRGRV